MNLHSWPSQIKLMLINQSCKYEMMIVVDESFECSMDPLVIGIFMGIEVL